MRKVQPGSPEWQPAHDRIEAHHRRSEQQVREADLPLCGLAGTALGAPRLASSAVENGVLEELGVGYGDPRAAGAVHVEVLTYRAGRHVDVVWLIEREQDEIDVVAPVGPANEVSIRIDGTEVRGLLREGGPVWMVLAARPDGGGQVGVLARNWPLGPLELATIDDPEPLLAERRRLIDESVDRPRSEPAAPVVDVRRSHRDLLEHVLADPASRPSRAQLLRYGQLWEAAVLAQMRLTDQDRATADGMVGLLANELVALQESADWFSGDAGLREAAIVESLLWVTGLDPRVPSAPAHEAWQARRGHSGRLSASHIPALRAERDRWRAAWAAWVSARS